MSHLSTSRHRNKPQNSHFRTTPTQPPLMKVGTMVILSNSLQTSKKEFYEEMMIPRRIPQMANCAVERTWIDEAIADQLPRSVFNTIFELASDTHQSICPSIKPFRANTRWKAAELGVLNPTYKGKIVQIMHSIQEYSGSMDIRLFYE